MHYLHTMVVEHVVQFDQNLQYELTVKGVEDKRQA